MTSPLIGIVLITLNVWCLCANVLLAVFGPLHLANGLAAAGTVVGIAISVRATQIARRIEKEAQ